MAGRFGRGLAYAALVALIGLTSCQAVVAPLVRLAAPGFAP